MYKSFTIAVLLLSAQSVHGQWHKIADFIGTDGSAIGTGPEIITCVYFLDLPGPPRIGFVGTTSDLWKTTDGGKNWYSVWDSNWAFSNYYVTDICFKDSLTGWFTVVGNLPSESSCYLTRDGGESWNPLNPPYNSEGGWFINYDSVSNLLFLTTANTYQGLVSNDFGKTWTHYPYATGQFVFFSPLIGIVSANWNDTANGYLLTKNGGLSWDSLIHPENEGGSLILPLEGTSTCFEADYGRIIVRRSNDYGATWHILKDFGPFADTNGNPIPNPAPFGTGTIEGDLSRLYIQTYDSGMYISTNQGLSWRPDGGPSWDYDGYPTFYVAKGVTIAGGTSPLGSNAHKGTGLWEELWPQSGVTPNAAPAAPEVSVYPNPTTGVVTISGVSGAVVVENVLGEVVMRNASSVMRDGSETLDLSSEPAGMYFVRLQTAYGEVQTVKLVKE